MLIMFYSGVMLAVPALVTPTRWFLVRGWAAPAPRSSMPTSTGKARSDLSGDMGNLM